MKYKVYVVVTKAYPMIVETTDEVKAEEIALDKIRNSFTGIFSAKVYGIDKLENEKEDNNG
jgi:hypothetical protein